MKNRVPLLLTLVWTLVSCGPRGAAPSPEKVPQTPSENSKSHEMPLASMISDTSGAEAFIQARVTFVQGTAWLQSGALSSAEEPVLPDTLLKAGDRLRTEADATVEVAYGTLATVRVLPQSECTVLGLKSILQDGSPRDRAELFLGIGALLVKVRKLAAADEFLIQTPNTAAGVRGTEYVIRYGAEKPVDSGKGSPGATIVAVRSGKVAVLPKGPLLNGLLDGRTANPLAGAVVSTAFAFAPVVGPGQELTIGGTRGNAAVEEGESRYGELVRAAEDAQAQGTDFEEVQDPLSVLAPASSALRRRMETMGSLVPITGFSDISKTYLLFLDRLRDPGAGASKLPAAFPQTFFTSPTVKTSAVTPGPSYPNLVWQKFVSTEPLSVGIGHVGPSILALDSRGLLHCFDDQGRSLWTAGPEVLAFTSLEQTVALVEKFQFRIVDGQSGAETGRWTYPGWAALPQYKGVPIPQGLAVATPQGVMILRQENAQIVKEIPLPGGVIAPLVLMDKRLAAYSGSGTLYFIDTATAAVGAQLSLDLGTEILTPRYMDGQGYLINRQGRVVAIDPTGDRILWERSLTQGIKTDPELDSQRLYLWTSDNSLRRLSTRDGSDVEPPLPSVDSPPLLSQGRLYLGRGKSLIVADAATLSIVKTLPLPDVPGGRPLIIDGFLYIGTRNGRLIRLDPTK